MTALLIRLFVKDSKNTADPATRIRYGSLSSWVSIFVNLLLAAAKLFAGTITHSIAITGDAINNISDIGTGAVTLAGFRMAGKSADEEHPFGHGRMEYICALAVSFLIFLMGFELFKSSVEKILHPELITFSVPACVVLILSILAKFWLAVFYRKIGKRIDSAAVSAAATDSISDTAATTCTLIALIVSRYTKIPLDGYLGVGVGVLIFIAAFSILKETIGPLLGESLDPALAKEISDFVLSHEPIVGVHDMMLHNYGPGHLFGSLHAEVPCDADVMYSHEVIDRIESEIQHKFGIHMVIHYDPIVVNDARIDALRAVTEKVVAEIHPDLSIHDFRVVDGEQRTNLIFDLVIPHKFPLKKAETVKLISAKMRAEHESYCCVITAEESFIAKSSEK